MQCTINSIEPGEGAPRTCKGPEASGTCPLATSGGLIACAGREIIIHVGGCGRLRLAVDKRATACPLAALGLAARPAPEPRR